MFVLPLSNQTLPKYLGVCEHHPLLTGHITHTKMSYSNFIVSMCRDLIFYVKDQKNATM
jgi:hypothetical protein